MVTKKRKKVKKDVNVKDKEGSVKSALIGLSKTIDKFSPLLGIERTRLEDELAAQASYYWNIAAVASSARNISDSLEDELKAMLADSSYRIKLAELENKEPSEARLERYIKGTKEYLSKQDALRGARLVQDKAERLVQAWNQRSYMLMKLADYEIARRYHEHDYSKGTQKGRKEMNTSLRRKKRKKE